MNSTKTKPAKRKLNVRLLRRIQRHILDEPRRFFMEGVVATGKPGSAFNRYHYWLGDVPDTAPACGTAACIHGWTALFSGKTPAQTVNLSLEWSARKLGLPVSARYSVFSVDDWPRKYAARYDLATTPKARAKIAADRIEWLIKTGK